MQASTAIPGTAGGNREYLSNDPAVVLEPQETPFTSMVSKVSEISNMLVEKLSDRNRPPRLTGAPEGKAGGQSSNQLARRGRFGVYPHKSIDSWAVTREESILAKRGGLAGVSDIADAERAKCELQVKRDRESVNLSAQECQDGQGGARDMLGRGALKWIQATAPTPTIDTNFLPPSNCILAHGQGTGVVSGNLFSEDDFYTLGRSLATVSGVKKRYEVFGGFGVVATIDMMSRVIARSNVPVPAVEQFYTTNNRGVESTITLMVNIYESSFFRAHVIPSVFVNLQSDGTGDPNSALLALIETWEEDMIEDIQEAETWTNAGGEGGHYQTSWALCCKSPRGNGKISNA